MTPPRAACLSDRAHTLKPSEVSNASATPIKCIQVFAYSAAPRGESHPHQNFFQKGKAYGNFKT